MGVQMIEIFIGRKGPSDRRIPGDDRDLGAGRRQKRGGNGCRKEITGSSEELLGPIGMVGKHRRAVEDGGQR